MCTKKPALAGLCVHIVVAKFLCGLNGLGACGGWRLVLKIVFAFLLKRTLNKELVEGYFNSTSYSYDTYKR